MPSPFISISVSSNGNLLVPQSFVSDDGSNLGNWVSTQRRRYKEKRIPSSKIDSLERIGMVWDPYDVQWQEYYDLAVYYFNENGNLLVPKSYITKNKKKLGDWISKQRESYKSNKLSKERIELLERIGMAWDGMRAIWDEMYEIARQYYEENNNLTISNSRFTYKDVSLGSWILTQRYNYSQNRLSDEQIRMLNEIGMEWVSTVNKDYIWDHNYNTVLEFYKKYKHLYIPTNYISKDGIQIGRWLYDQKLQYKNNELDEYRKSKLDLLDPSWLDPSNSKSSFPEQAVLFYVKKFFPSACKLKNKDVSEIDIYIPELKTGVEYDGPSHIRSVKKDIKKSKKCKELGVDLIRIRDCQCPIINDESYKIILKDDSFEALDHGIIELLTHLRVSDINISVKWDYDEIIDNYVQSIDLDWHLAYEKLVDYYHEYGNINVPIYYKTDDGFMLGHWLSNIRSSVKNPSLKNIRMSSNKKELLDQLGMDWSPLDTQWEKMYSLAEEYYSTNGDLLVPDKYIVGDNNRLGKWIGTQRFNYKENILTSEKIALLEKIGMVWSVHDYEWMIMYNQAVDYFQQNGNLLIPLKYTTSDNSKLGVWIGSQRKRFKDNTMTDNEIDLLNKIGMVWSVTESQWYEMYDLAVEYYRTNGNLLVPHNYLTENDKSLGLWIGTQRKKYKSNQLSEKELSLLNKIGMVWYPSDSRWNEFYDLAVEYYKEEGNLLVPQRYKTKDNKPLGSWLGRQRAKYQSNQLSAKEISLLNKIGMVWSVSESQWLEMYELAVDYYKEKGNLLVPRLYKTKDDKSLGLWVHRQRAKYKSNIISDKEISLLDAIGMVWNLKKQ